MIQIFDYYLINSVCLPEPNQMAQGFASSSGWGLTRFADYVLPGILQKADDLPIVEEEDCKKIYVKCDFELIKCVNEGIICCGGSWSVCQLLAFSSHVYQILSILLNEGSYFYTFESRLRLSQTCDQLYVESQYLYK